MKRFEAFDKGIEHPVRRFVGYIYNGALHYLSDSTVATFIRTDALTYGGRSRRTARRAHRRAMNRR